MQVNDREIGPEEAFSHRAALILFRNEALKHKRFDWALGLSETIAIFTALAILHWGDEFESMI